MKPERWQRIEELYHEALDRESAERSVFVRDACEGDEDLRREVESLLDSYEEAPEFINEPVVEEVLRLVVADNDGSLIGRQINHYRIVSVLGVGGMGEVYLAEDVSLGRRVALKILPAELTSDRDRLGRFKQEARAASALNHPNILTIHEIGESGGRPFIATEFIEGQTLRQSMELRLSESDVLQYATQIASGLAAAHRKGIIHRDIKPENIMVRDDGILKILDFGLAKLMEPIGPHSPEDSTMVQTNSGMLMGTVKYMSPEQARGEDVDSLTDIWSLGAVLYEALSGQSPHGGNSTAEVLVSILERDAPPLASVAPNVSPFLARIIHKCLEKDRDDRYASAEHLIAEFKLAGGARANNSEQETRSLAGVSVQKRELPRFAKLGVGAAAVVLAPLALYWLFFQSQLITYGAEIRSVAVLPFENLSGDPGKEHFVAGMHSGLINDLSKVGALRVISRRSVMRYQGSDKPIPQIARELNVDGIVEGSVVRNGDSVTIQVQLIRVLPDEKNLWTQTYERSVREIKSVFGEAARDIAHTVNINLAPEEAQRLTRSDQVDPETYELYLKGMFFIGKGGRENVLQGLDHLNQAVERDPGDAFAYAGLALGYGQLGHGPSPIEDVWPKARAAAEKAIMLDPQLAAAHLAHAEVKTYWEWDWVGAEQSFKRAMEINPNLAMAHFHYAWYLVLFGRIDEAIAEHIRAKELDPFQLGHTAWLGGLYNYQGRYDEAVAAAEEALAIDPEFPPGLMVLGRAYREKGMYQQAIEVHEKLATVAPPQRSYLAITYAKAGRTDDARRILSEFEAEKAGPWRAFSLGIIYLALGERDKAFEACAYEPHHAFLPWLAVEPFTPEIRDDPRFTALLERVKLPQAEAYKGVGF